MQFLAQKETFLIALISKLGGGFVNITSRMQLIFMTFHKLTSHVTSMPSLPMLISSRDRSHDSSRGQRRLTLSICSDQEQILSLYPVLPDPGGSILYPVTSPQQVKRSTKYPIIAEDAENRFDESP